MHASNSLAPGTVLHECYRIERTLGQGGYGITYLATDITLDKYVAIKEFFPKTLCNRDDSTSYVSVGTQGSEELVERLRKKFLKEARNVAKFDEANIIRIYAAFEANNTAYYVMEYVDGESLAELVNREGALSEERAVGYIKQVADALAFIHANHLNHLDVKPANIMVRRTTDRIVLIDFGLSKRYDEEGNQTSTTPIGISHGYAPIEQYKQGGVCSFSPEADIYSLGATLYKLLTGLTPPDAVEVAQGDLPGLPLNISESTRTAVVKAMNFNKANRPHSIAEFVELLDTIEGKLEEHPTELPTPEPTPTPAPQPMPTPEPTPAPKRERRALRIALWCLVGIFIVGFVVAGFSLLRSYWEYSDEIISDDGIPVEELDLQAIEDSIYYMEEAEADTAAY